MNKQTGIIIKKYREEAGLTQDNLAEKLEVNEKTIRRWENGMSKPDSQTINKIATILQISPRIFNIDDITDPLNCLHLLFQIEDTYRLTPKITDEGIYFKFPKLKSCETKTLIKLLKQWCEIRNAFDKKIISKFRYRAWKARYPDFANINPDTGLPVFHLTNK